jgi:hypothetical protein
MADAKEVKIAKRSVSKVMAYRKVFDSPEGKKVLLDMMDAHGMLNCTYTGDVNKMLLKEGERNVILRILALLKMDVAQLQERIDSYVKENL